MTWRRAALLYGQLATLLDAGLPIDRALDLAGEAAGGSWRTTARGWAETCRHGSPLHAAMAAGRTDPLAVALVRAGEASGALPACCRHLAGQYETWARTRSDVLARLAYPLLVLHLALAVPALPSVVAGDAGWPRLLAGPALLWLAAAGAIAAWWALRRGTILDRLALLPPLALVLSPLVTANLAAVLQAALGAGLRVGESFALAAGACGNRLVAARLQAAGAALENQRRHAIAPALAECGAEADLVGLVQAGEAGGSLERTLGQVAGIAYERFSLRLRWTARLAGAAAYALAVIATLIAILSVWSASYGSALREASAALEGG